MKISEEEVRRMSHGDAEAFRSIYNRCWDTLYFFVRKETGAWYYSECVAEAVFSAVWANRARLTRYTALRDYMAFNCRDYTMLALKYFASKTLEGAFPHDEAGRREAVTRGLTRVLDGEHYKGIFKKIMGDLPAHETMIFHFGVTGSSLHEMSRLMDMPADTVRKHFCDAIVRLNERMKQEVVARHMANDRDARRLGITFFH